MDGWSINTNLISIAAYGRNFRDAGSCLISAQPPENYQEHW